MPPTITSNLAHEFCRTQAQDDDETDAYVHRITRYSDGTVKLRNPNIELMDQDILYHLALGSESHDLPEMFGDVKTRQLATSVLFHSSISTPEPLIAKPCASVGYTTHNSFRSSPRSFRSLTTR
ncbi:hypothetical protein ACLKA7_009205 [Drosophila subpalustris]